MPEFTSQALPSPEPDLLGRCPACGVNVPDDFVASRLVNLAEPHASVLELFLRVRGNAREVKRELGLSYPTVRARLDDAFAAARSLLDRTAGAPPPPQSWRTVILEALERGALTPAEAVARLHAGREREGPGATAGTAAERKRVLAMVAAAELSTDDADAILGGLSGPPPTSAPFAALPAGEPAAGVVAASPRPFESPRPEDAVKAAPAWRALVVRASEGGEVKVNARLPLELARDADRFLPRQAKHYLARCGLSLEALLKRAGRFDHVRGAAGSRWAMLLRRLATLPGDGTLAHVRDGDVELTITLE